MEKCSQDLDKWSGTLIPDTVIRKQLVVLAHNLHKYIQNHAILSPIRQGGNYFWKMLEPMLEKVPKVISIKVVSYRDNRLPGTPILEIPDDYPAKGNHIILLDDIVDTGGTQNALTRQLLVRKAEDVKMVCLLDKPSRRRYPISPSLTGFVIPNLFVFGCGMDWQGEYRDLTEIRYVLP